MDVKMSTANNYENLWVFHVPRHQPITHLLTYATAFSGRNFHVTQRKSLEIQTRSITIIITCRGKLLNADWLRQRAFFLNQEGMIT